VLMLVFGIALPLMIGYAITLDAKRWTGYLNFGLSQAIYLMIFLTGSLFGVEPNIEQLLFSIGVDGILFVSILTLCNCLGLYGVSVWFKSSAHILAEPQSNQSTPIDMSESLLTRIFRGIQELKVVLVLVLGYWFGQVLAIDPAPIQFSLMSVLALLMVLIGLELRMHQISLAAAFLNIKGLSIAIIMVLSCLIAGIIIALISEIPLNKSIAITAGYGWYSLSGVLITKEAGAYLGGLAFSMDIAREILIIICLPLMRGLSPMIGVGYCGATAMDATLPLLKKSYGIAVVPIALSSGVILSVLSPVMILIFI